MTLTCISRSCVFLQIPMRSRHSEAWNPGSGAAAVMGYRLQVAQVMCSTCIQSSTANLLGRGIVRSPSAECFHLDSYLLRSELKYPGGQASPLIYEYPPTSHPSGLEGASVYSDTLSGLSSILGRMCVCLRDRETRLHCLHLNCQN